MKKVILAMISLICTPVFSADVAKPEISWATDLSEAIKRADKEKKWVFVDFYADWCPPCKEMERSVFSDDEVKAIFSKLITVRVNGDKQPEVMEEYGVGVYPTIMVIDGKGNVLERVNFLVKSEFLEVFKPISNGVNPLETLKKKLADNPEDGQIQLEGGVKYMRLKKYDSAIQALGRAVKLLPNNEKNHLTAMGSLFQIYVETGKPAEAKEELAQIEKAYPGVVDQKMAQIGVGVAYSKAGNKEEAIRIWEKSIPHLEDSRQKESLRKMIDDLKKPETASDKVESASKE